MNEFQLIQIQSLLKKVHSRIYFVAEFNEENEK